MHRIYGICFVISSQKQCSRTYFFMQTLALWLKPPSCIVQFVRNKCYMAVALFVFKLWMLDFGMIFAYLSPKWQLKLNFFIVLKLSSDSAPQNISQIQEIRTKIFIFHVVSFVFSWNFGVNFLFLTKIVEFNTLKIQQSILFCPKYTATGYFWSSWLCLQIISWNIDCMGAYLIAEVSE